MSGLMQKGLYVGCTLARHRQIGVHAPINAKVGEAWRNETYHSEEEIEQMRDAQKVRQWRQQRIRFHQFGSRLFRRRLQHILEEIGAE